MMSRAEHDSGAEQCDDPRLEQCWPDVSRFKGLLATSGALPSRAEMGLEGSWIVRVTTACCEQLGPAACVLFPMIPEFAAPPR
jgi:hypothetical protein